MRSSRGWTPTWYCVQHSVNEKYEYKPYSCSLFPLWPHILYHVLDAIPQFTLGWCPLLITFSRTLQLSLSLTRKKTPEEAPNHTQKNKACSICSRYPRLDCCCSVLQRKGWKLQLLRIVLRRITLLWWKVSLVGNFWAHPPFDGGPIFAIMTADPPFRVYDTCFLLSWTQ